MNARPQPMRPERSLTFKAWRNDRPIADFPAIAACSSIDEVANLLARVVTKGTVLTILMTDAGRNKSKVAFYTVKESTKRYSWRPSTNGGKPVKVGALEPALLHVLDVLAFAPVEAFDAFRDDPVGRDMGLVDVKEEGL